MPTYKMSNGDRIEKSTIDRKVSEAKGLKIEEMMDDQGYIACEDCGISSGVYLDCSHDVSVNDCQKNGTSELAWDVKNITIRCRPCHQLHDNTY